MITRTLNPQEELAAFRRELLTAYATIEDLQIKNQRLKKENAILFKTLNEVISDCDAILEEIKP